MGRVTRSTHPIRTHLIVEAEGARALCRRCTAGTSSTMTGAGS